MIQKHLFNILKENLHYNPTQSQNVLLEKISEFLSDPSNPEIFILKGYAGTGKTTLINTIIKTLDAYKINSALMAPTGRAAKVLTSYTGKSATTIHKRIYRQKSAGDGFGAFVLNRNLFKNTLFIVDEASMISDRSAEANVFGSGNLLDDMMEFVYSGHNCKIILVGDNAQLPPVFYDQSPALDAFYMQKYGMPVKECQLTDVVRQAQNSGILSNATALRNEIAENDFFEIPKFHENSLDFKNIKGEDLLERITNAYDADGLENTIVVTRSNKRANQYNQGIRASILYREEELQPGDFLMVVKNNYFWSEKSKKIDFVANGDIVKVTRVRRMYELYGFRFADIEISLPDYDDEELEVTVLMDTLTSESASMTTEENKKLFYAVTEDYAEESTKKKQFKKTKENAHFNALQVKFAYAVTCHKAQGGQWTNVFVDQGYFAEDMINLEYYRWLYTAITRATSKVFLVNFKEDFFVD